MLQKRLMIVLGLVVAISMVLTACGLTTPKATPTPTVTQAFVPTQTPVPTPQPPQASDTIVVGTWQEPRSFLAYENSQAIRAEMMEIFQPPFVTVKDFGLQANPVLVDGDLPTLDNGGAVLNDLTVKQGAPIFNPATFSVVPATTDTPAKQLVVTYKIKSGLKWSDGQSLTANDFVLAWKTNCTLGANSIDMTYCPLGSTNGAGGLYSNYAATDDTTLVATYTPGVMDPLYSYIGYGIYGILPAHIFQGMTPANIESDQRATGGDSGVPLAYGAYMMKEWKRSDHITFVPNPNWEGPAPKTPNIIYKHYPDSIFLSRAVIAGDVDTSSGVAGVDISNAPYLDAVAKRGLISFTADKNPASLEMLYFNYDDETDKSFKTEDLNHEKPHPVLSDYNIRKAIAMALAYQNMADAIFFGYSSVVDQPQLPQMASYDSTLGKLAYDVNGANQLLDSAGWAPGPDGIRVKNNVHASLTLLTASDSPISQKASKIIQASLEAIGIEVKFNYQPSSVVVSGDGLYSRNFDMIEYAKVFSKVDPGSWWYNMANCKQIPTGVNNFAGNNFAGWCNKDASDASADAAYLTLEPAQRKADWGKVLKNYFAPPTSDTDYRSGGYPVVPLFARPNFLAANPNLQGVGLNPTEYFTWDVETWTLQKK